MNVEISTAAAPSFRVRTDLAGELCVEGYALPSYKEYHAHCDATNRPCNQDTYRAFAWRVVNRGVIATYRLWTYRANGGLHARMGDVEWTMEVPFPGLVANVFAAAYAASGRQYAVDGYLVPISTPNKPTLSRYPKCGLWLDVIRGRGYVVPLVSLFPHLCGT